MESSTLTKCADTARQIYRKSKAGHIVEVVSSPAATWAFVVGAHQSQQLPELSVVNVAKLKNPSNFPRVEVPGALTQALRRTSRAVIPNSVSQLIYR